MSLLQKYKKAPGKKGILLSGAFRLCWEAYTVF